MWYIKKMDPKRIGFLIKAVYYCIQLMQINLKL